MAKDKLPYREGDVIAVPLRDGKYALGVIARASRQGILAGYFFAHPLDRVPRIDEVPDLRPTDASLPMLFGDLGLIEHQWPVIGRLSEWRRDEWPMPIFARCESLTGRCFRVEYPDDGPADRPREVEISASEAAELPRAALAGFQFVEERLSELVRPSGGATDIPVGSPSRLPPDAHFYLYFPDESTAQRAAAELREEGYEVDVRPAAGEENWLTFAKKVIADNELDATEDRLTELTNSLGGEYDGLERPVG